MKRVSPGFLDDEVAVQIRFLLCIIKIRHLEKHLCVEK